MLQHSGELHVATAESDDLITALEKIEHKEPNVLRCLMILE